MVQKEVFAVYVTNTVSNDKTRNEFNTHEEAHLFYSDKVRKYDLKEDWRPPWGGSLNLSASRVGCNYCVCMMREERNYTIIEDILFLCEEFPLLKLIFFVILLMMLDVARRIIIHLIEG